jgi:hypothetical protein
MYNETRGLVNKAVMRKFQGDMITVKNQWTVIVCILLILIGGGVYFGKQKYDSVLKATSEGLALGKAYGKMVNQGNCILGLQMKYSSCSDTECELSANGYIVGCFETATRDSFCSSVPNIRNTDKAVTWVSNACSEYQVGKEKCLKYMHKIISVCTEQKDNMKLSTKELFESGFEKGLRKD